ncbi:MAG: DNA-binding protein [Lysobacteraceae bacterium]
MARKGITEDQVAAAADALLRSGEKPTIERVRAELGTGSPQTVIRHLDTWWSGLGERLERAEAKTAIPSAPDGVNDAASALWILAFEQASAVAEKALDDRHQALAQQEQLLAEREQEAAQSVADATQRAETAEKSLQETVESLTEERQTVKERDRQILDLREDRGQLVGRLSSLESERDRLTKQVVELASKAESERSELQRYVREVEDRSQREIDRARTESKDLAREIRAIRDETRNERAAASQKHEEILTQARLAEGLVARQDEHARELSVQLERSQAALRDALALVNSRSTGRSKPKSPATKKKPSKRAANP